MATLLRGAPVATALCERLAGRIEALEQAGITPGLAIVRVGERPDDIAYERAASRRAERLGIVVHRTVLDKNCSQDDLEQAIDVVNADASVHGCMLLRPLPAHLDERSACECLSSSKDIDGITPGSLAGVFCGFDTGFPPCTAAAVMELLDFYHIELSGKRVAVVGRSLVVGRPLALLLLGRDATVTLCHSRTNNLAEVLRQADIVVAAVGRAGLIDATCVQPGQTIIDVGTNWDENLGSLVGDVAHDQVDPLVAAVSPVPGGVGSITTAVLALHVVEAAERMVDSQ